MKPIAPLALLLTFAAPAIAEDPAAIGYADMQRVLEQSNMGKKANIALKEKYSAPQEALAAEEQSIRQLQQRVSRDAALMSQDELKKRQTEIQGRILKFQQQANATQQELAKDQAALGQDIIKPAQRVIAEIAKEKKLAAVFERNQSGFLYVADGLNLTDDVIKRLNAETGQ